MAQGFRHVRVQVGVPGMAGYGSGRGDAKVAGAPPAPVFEPAVLHPPRAQALRGLPQGTRRRSRTASRRARTRIAHSGVQFCKDVEEVQALLPRRSVQPEDIAWFRIMRQQCTTPIAMGELFNSPHEWTPLIGERLIDYIRIHVSQAGGLTPCRKVAAFGELYRRQDRLARTRRRVPHRPRRQRRARPRLLQLRHPGILAFSERVQEVFSGCPEDERRLSLRQRKARLGHRSERSRRERSTPSASTSAASASGSTAAGAKSAAATAPSSNSSRYPNPPRLHLRHPGRLRQSIQHERQHPSIPAQRRQHAFDVRIRSKHLIRDQRQPIPRQPL
jgi:hypothetical protein